MTDGPEDEKQPEAPAAAAPAPHPVDKSASPFLKGMALTALRVIRSVVHLNEKQSALWDQFVAMLETLVL